jgi:HPt (histidine-containing phosphotransfer) domain-containing protein
MQSAHAEIDRASSFKAEKAEQRLVQPIDFKHLRRYTLGDRSLEKEVLALFLEQAPITIAGLAKAKPGQEWHDLAHALKGSSRAVGAFHMSRLAEQVEDLGDRLTAAARGDALEALQHELNAVREFLGVS